MVDFWVGASRGPIIESRHDVSVAVVNARGKMIASVGDVGLTTFWRSAAKAFQVYPLVELGGLEHFPIDREMLALACGSHNAETFHLEVARRWLQAIDLPEATLACGGHPSLWQTLADDMLREHITPTPIWSNCSGKHAALLALAQLKRWPLAGYESLGHPVQDQVTASFSRWSGVAADKLIWGVDGCTAAAVALPLQSMAVAYVNLATAADSAAKSLCDAMMSEPMMVAGTDRIDTALMQAWPGRVLVKAGAEGVFCAALPTLGIGLALKVHDGDTRSSNLALVRVLEEVTSRFAATDTWPLESLAPWRNPIIRNTRGAITGSYSVNGGLRFL